MKHNEQNVSVTILLSKVIGNEQGHRQMQFLGSFWQKKNSELCQKSTRRRPGIDRGTFETKIAPHSYSMQK